MRKFLLNPRVLSSLGGALGVAKATKNAPKDWRTWLLWISWAIGVALAIGAVMDNDRSTRLDELKRELKK